MIECTLVFDDADLNAHCASCGEGTLWAKGPRIVVADSEEPICRRCGQLHAPRMLALLDLAQTADKVGRNGRHLLTPTMESLLELARAAETYAEAHPTPQSRAS